jgi:hypothetical protein
MNGFIIEALKAAPDLGEREVLTLQAPDQAQAAEVSLPVAGPGPEPR